MAEAENTAVAKLAVKEQDSPRASHQAKQGPACLDPDEAERDRQSQHPDQDIEPDLDPLRLGRDVCVEGGQNVQHV